MAEHHEADRARCAAYLHDLADAVAEGRIEALWVVAVESPGQQPAQGRLSLLGPEDDGLAIARLVLEMRRHEHLMLVALTDGALMDVISGKEGG